MTVMVDSGRAIISRAVLRSRDVDPVIARLRLSSALSGVQLEPYARAAQLVVVRKLSSGLPSGLLEGTGVVRMPAWERALRETLASQIARAARPARGELAAAADAVVFADESEFLACLGRDWSRGRCDAWWWRVLFPQGIDEVQVVRAWRKSIGALPAAARALHESGCAVTFLRRLEPSSAAALAMDMAIAFGLAGVHGALSVGALKVRSAADKQGAVDRTSQSVVEEADPGSDSPWSEWLSNVDVGALHTSAKCLLGVALALEHAPRHARSVHFSKQLSLWLARETRREHAETTVQPKPPKPAPPATAARGGTPDHRRDAPSMQTTPGAAYAMQPHPEGGVKGAAPARARAAAGVSAPEYVTGTEKRRFRNAGLGRSSVFVSRRTADRSEPEARRVDQVRDFRTGPAAPMPDAMEVIDSAFGGVFYLVNVALVLGLYGDFSQPLRPGLKLSLWDLLALTGDRLTHGRLRSDPLWRLLARLAGRSMDDVPGQGFSPAGDWRVPASWLRGFPRAERWTWTAARGRLRIQHPAGFAVAEVALRGRGAQSCLDQLLWQYREHAPDELAKGRAPRRTVGKGTGRLQRWLDFLVEYLSARLRLALEGDVGEALCAHRARIALCPASIDVSMDLESLPIAIRMAGLDRDPGWVPAAGRTFRFHFE